MTVIAETSTRPSSDTGWRKSGRLLRLVAIAFALFWSLAPIYWMLSTSLKTELEATRLDPTLVPENPTLDNYIGLAGTTLPFFDFFLNTVVVGFTTFGLPFAVWMLKSFIDAVPIEIEEAARVDGYPRWQVLLRVVVPLIIPGILTTGTFVFMEAWNNLIYPLTFITSLDKQTLPAALVLTFTGQFKTDWGGMMAAATITTLPLVIAFFAVQRSMVRGLTSGAVAGA